MHFDIHDRSKREWGRVCNVQAKSALGEQNDLEYLVKITLTQALKKEK